MSLQQAAEMALKYFEDAYGLEDTEIEIREALRKALRDRLAQPEPEPVAKYSDVISDGGFDPRYTAPPKREWVGLTHEELAWLNEALNLGGRFAVIEAIEAKLKEKNT